MPDSSPRSRPGSPYRADFALQNGASFLNHGSFGACPRGVLERQAVLRAEMESQPDRFFRRHVMPDAGDTPLRAAAAALARFVNAGADSIAFVENATAGVQAALRSIALAPGDRILINDHTYNAVRLMVEARCRETGAVPVVARLPIPADADSIVAAFEAAMDPAVRIAIVDHITSPTALVMPLARIIPVLRRWGARVIVDGAHGVGQVPLDLATLGADWYVSNAHKWLFAPRGTAFLHASPDVASLTQPLVVSHFVEMGFPRAFDWVGTRDYTAWLSVPAAIDFHRGLDAAAVSSHRQRLLEAFSVRMEALGARPAGPMALCASMRSFVMPRRSAVTREDAKALLGELWERSRIQAMATTFGDDLIVRASAQVYVEEQEMRALGDALERGGWPGR
jgi:isopenicillin-N epimerase